MRCVIPHYCAFAIGLSYRLRLLERSLLHSSERYTYYEPIQVIL